MPALSILGVVGDVLSVGEACGFSIGDEIAFGLGVFSEFCSRRAMLIRDGNCGGVDGEDERELLSGSGEAGGLFRPPFSSANASSFIRSNPSSLNLLSTVTVCRLLSIMPFLDMTE